MTQQTRIWATGPSGEVLPVVCDAQGNLVIQLEGATINIGDVDVVSSVLPSGAASASNQTTEISKLDAIKTAVEGATPAGTYRGKDRTTTTGAAEELTIPANSKRCIISCGPSSQAYIELNGDATTGSPIYFEDPFGPILLDLGSVTKLSAYVVAGNVGAVFFG